MNQHRKLFGASLAIGLATALIGLGFAIVKISTTQDDTQFIVDQLVDCLDPKGECYQSAQRQRDTDVAVQIVIGACAAGFADLPDAQRIRSTQRCVANWLNHHKLPNEPEER